MTTLINTQLGLVDPETGTLVQSVRGLSGQRKWDPVKNTFDPPLEASKTPAKKAKPEPKVEEAEVEEPKVEEAEVVTKKVEAQKVEAKKVEVPKPEPSKKWNFKKADKKS